MVVNLENLKEQADNLNACLENLRSNIGKYPDYEEAKRIESMMMSSLIALNNHIRELEKLGLQDYSPNVLRKL